MKQDYYAVLGLNRKASAEDVQRAYRTLALRYHPDRNTAADAASRMTAINEAYETLGEPSRRREYDRRMVQPGPGVELSASILLAARDLLLRSGWRVLEDNGKNLLLESAKNRVRIVFANLLDEGVMSRASREPELTIVLAVAVDPRLEGRTVAALRTSIGIDLMRRRRYGPPFPDALDGPCRSLLTPFL
jgi:curved DNA-binding protein CbpA